MAMKLLILGPARHGKDTLAEILHKKAGLTFRSSSEFVAERFGMQYLKDEYGLHYESLEECMQDRYNHRDKWYFSVRAYLGKDLSKLARNIFAEYDIYVGMRGLDELDHLGWMSATGQLDFPMPTTVWVGAPNRVGFDQDSQQIGGDNLICEKHCRISIKNDEAVVDLEREAVKLLEYLETT